LSLKRLLPNKMFKFDAILFSPIIIYNAILLLL
jgi:hypothetical protein